MPRNVMAFKFSTKFAIRLSSFVVIVMGVLSLICSLCHLEVTKYRGASVSNMKIKARKIDGRRRVRRVRQMKETVGQEPITVYNGFNFSSESCEDLNTYFDRQITETNETGRIDHRQKQKCAYARTCDDGDGVYAPIIYCLQQNYATKVLVLMAVMVLLLVWMVVLFRMICSTAEDFFSPSLEMFSVQMGLPPRFAGVTLLALGNGAPDVASMLSAMETGSKNTYMMGIGELIGSSMFISTVISAIIVYSFCSLSATNESHGVPCKGALVRDVVMLGLTMAVTHIVFRSESKTSAEEKLIPFFLFGLYFLYTFIVFLADMHHRKYVFPRLKSQRLSISLHQSSRSSSDDRNDQSDLSSDEKIEIEAAEKEDFIVIQDEMTPLRSTTCCSNGYYESSTLTVDSHHHLPIIKEDEPCHHPVVDHFFESLSNYGKDGTDIDDDIGWGMNAASGEERLVVLSHPHYLHKGVVPLPLKSATSTCKEDSSLPNVSDNENFIGRFFSTNVKKERWNNLWNNEMRDIQDHLRRQLWDDIYRSDEINTFEKILLTFEMPFLILRMFTVPIPCDGYYCRPLVGLSLIFSPLWLLFYSYMEYGINPIFDKDYASYTFFLFASFFIIGVIFLCFSPVSTTSTTTTVSFGNEYTKCRSKLTSVISVPIALYGFIVAATWIDTVADQLVSLLSFFGILCHIPGEVMGLTVLAIGNSIGDLTANATMARKGLVNMAITACFAGPVFSVLIGVGLAMYIWGAELSDLHLTQPLQCAILFSILNCALLLICGFHRGHLYKSYSYGALILYAVYGCFSLYIIS